MLLHESNSRGGNRASLASAQGSQRKKVLVTGGGGFLGSYLCERLLNEDREVLCLDNFATGHMRNIETLRSNSNFRLIQQDVIEPFAAQVDEIYNLACPASPPDYQSDPIQTMKTNVLGALNILALAREQNARIFQASTSEVYGDPTVHPQTESYWGNVNPIGPRACYDEGKRCAETLFFDYSRRYGIPIKVCRIFNTYGPRMRPDDGRVVSNFIVQALRGESLTIYGDGTQTRSFCYVDDLIEGFQCLMKSPDSVTGPINLGNPSEFTIRELAERVIDITGSRSRILHLSLPVDDPQCRCPDIRLATESLGWKPRISLPEGLEKTVVYFDDLLRRETPAVCEVAA
jgi:UDP-glucuronate decarboxylase